MRLADLEGKPFVYYPLQTEPEFAFNAQSPEYFFQLETIAQVARDLPAGIPLAVKETLFAIGRRPKNFYAQIRDLKNVVFLDVMESGLEVIKCAAVTVAITGSAGHEAAVLGKPVISFGRHNPYSFLRHVKVVRDSAELKGYLNEALFGEFDAEQAAIDGQKFFKSIAAFSFDLEDFNLLDATAAPAQAIDAAYEALLNSLAWHTAEPTGIDVNVASSQDARVGA